MMRAMMVTGLLLAAAQAQAAAYTNLYVFGDSLVDAGNVTAANGDRFNPVAAGYFPGRFQDGPAYTDLLNQRIEGALLTPSLLGGDNFAWGGARAGPGAAVPRLSAQVSSYVGRAGTADARALYIINIGGNDVFALRSGNTGGLTAAQYTADFIGGIVGAVTALNAAGARNIMVAGLPFAAGTPGVGPLQTALDTQLDAIMPGFQGNLFRYSYQATYAKILADPAAYGLTATPNFTGTCIALRPMTPQGRDCTGIFSFDGIHPTAVVHRTFYRDVAALVGVGVPEPATWAMMIVGFGAVGVAMRRKAGRAAEV